MAHGEKNYYVHEKAICEATDIGRGTRIWGFSHVQADAHLGADVNIGEHVFVESGVTIGNGCTIKNGVAIWKCVTLEDYVFVGPYVVFTNDLRPRAFLKRGEAFYAPTRIQKGATLGANCTIVCGTTVHAFSMVGAGTVVTQDVASHTLVVGNPARVIAMICFCGEKLDAKDFCSFCRIPLIDNSMDRTRQILEDYRRRQQGIQPGTNKKSAS